MKTYLVISDIHVPYHCPKYIELSYKILRSLKFDGLVQLGDALDFWQLSTYDKDPARKNTILEDIEVWNGIISKWSRYLPKGATVHLLCGNHEARLERYISRHARELHEIVKPMPDLLNLKQRNEAGQITFKWHKYSKWDSCRIGDCTLLHGFYFNQHVASTNLAKYRTKVVCGHTHRVQYVSDGVHFSASLGHGSDENLTAHQPTPTGWQQAMGVLTVDDRNQTNLEIITVTDGKAVFRGKHFSA